MLILKPRFLQISLTRRGRQAFRQLAFHAQERRIALFIDEVTYLIDVNPDLVGILQKHGIAG